MRAGYAVAALHLALTPAILAQPFCLKDTFVGHNFFDAWNWETADDPTHGRVNYVDQQTAMSSNLSYATDSKFVMRADDLHNVSSSARGRDSIRISSKAAYSDSITVLDLEHMPEGCSTWPAFWTLSQAGPWPHGGEIDIIEGVNLNEQNLASLHTTPNCSMPQTRLQSGSTVSTNCDTSVNGNQGCGTSSNKPNSYGSCFNDNNGGWYVMQRSAESGINVWFWPRDDITVPWSVVSGDDKIMPDFTWGLPDASFPGDNCDYNSHFDAHQIIFDLTFCGDWAGSVFPTSGCGPSTCEDFVNNNPSAFVKAYWEINSLRVYTPT